MRISLVGSERQTQRRRSRSQGARVYHAAISQPWEGQAWRPRRVRTTSRRSQVEPQRRADGPLHRATRRLLAVMAQWFTPARWLLTLALAALLGVIGLASFDVEFFVYEGRVVGARHVEPSRIYEIAGIHEKNIFWIQPRKVARNVLGIEGVKTVRVRCALPSNVTIEVVEREPVVLWRLTVQGRDLWLDNEGVVLPYHGDPTLPTTLFVVDSSSRDLKEGDRIEPAGLIPSLLELAATMPQARIFFYSADRGLSYLQQVDGAQWPVYVGTSDSLQRKFHVVSAITDYLTETGIRPSYIDVRWPDRPVFGLSDG